MPLPAPGEVGCGQACVGEWSSRAPLPWQVFTGSLTCVIPGGETEPFSPIPGSVRTLCSPGCQGPDSFQSDALLFPPPSLAAPRVSCRDLGSRLADPEVKAWMSLLYPGPGLRRRGPREASRCRADAGTSAPSEPTTTPDGPVIVLHTGQA